MKQEWVPSKGYFRRCTLSSLGHRVQLGHDPGVECSNRSKDVREDIFTVVDTTGVHQIHLDFCRCGNFPSATTQLLRARLFPASWFQPRTAFTFRLLDDYRNLTCNSRLTAHHFWEFLRQKTDGTGLRIVPVSLAIFQMDNIS
jgi:hypothetical protein